MSFFDKDVSVILVDWHNLASFTGVMQTFINIFLWVLIEKFDDWNNYAYDYSARNAIDVGEFLGLCLGELRKRYAVS